MYRSIAILFALSAASLANANSITFTYTGTISQISDNVPAVRGQVLTFSFTFDSQAIGTGLSYGTSYPFFQLKGALALQSIPISAVARLPLSTIFLSCPPGFWISMS